MAEPINLDELMDKPSAYESNTSSEDTDSTEDSFEDNTQGSEFEGSSESDSQEDAGTSDDNGEYEDTGSQESASDEYTETFEEESKVDVSGEQEQTVSEYKFKDDFIKKAVEYYEKYGTLTPYLEETATDYDALTDLDILKKQFDKDNADLSEKS